MDPGPGKPRLAPAQPDPGTLRLRRLRHERRHRRESRRPRRQHRRARRAGGLQPHPAQRPPRADGTAAGNRQRLPVQAVSARLEGLRQPLCPDQADGRLSQRRQRRFRHALEAGTQGGRPPGRPALQFGQRPDAVQPVRVPRRALRAGQRDVDALRALRRPVLEHRARAARLPVRIRLARLDRKRHQRLYQLRQQDPQRHGLSFAQERAHVQRTEPHLSAGGTN